MSEAQSASERPRGQCTGTFLPGGQRGVRPLLGGACRTQLSYIKPLSGGARRIPLFSLLHIPQRWYLPAAILQRALAIPLQKFSHLQNGIETKLCSTSTAPLVARAASKVLVAVTNRSLKPPHPFSRPSDPILPSYCLRNPISPHY